MVASQTVLSILDEAAAAIGGWTALQSIRCVHLDSERQDWEPWQAHDIGPRRLFVAAHESVHGTNATPGIVRFSAATGSGSPSFARLPGMKPEHTAEQ